VRLKRERKERENTPRNEIRTQERLQITRNGKRRDREE